MPAPYVELHSHSNFSFLDGGSHPYELAMRAAELEMPALAITDRGGVYGTVRHLQACRKLGVKPIIGTSLEVDGEELILIARDLRGYSNLCRLLTLAHADQPKGEARTTLDTVAEHRGELFYLSPTDREQRMRELQGALGKENVFSELHHHRRPEDEWVLEGRAAMARRCGAGVVATNEVHYHVAERRRLHDVLVAIRHRATLDEARAHLFPNSEHHLKGGADLRPLFHGHAEALATPWEIAQECDVDLDFRKVRFPGYPVPAGETPFSFLYKLCFEGVRDRYRPITPAVAQRLQRELEVIEKTGLAEFFLINWDLMRFAREHGVPGQGRGSRPPGQRCRPLVYRRRRGLDDWCGAAARYAASELAAVPRAVPRGHRFSPPPLDPQRRHARHRRATGRHRAGRARDDGRAPRRPVQQGRRRRPGPDQDGHARAAHSVGGRGGARADQGHDRDQARPRPAASERPGRLRDVPAGRPHRGVLDREAA